jgi:hypothetical protein
LGCPRKKKRWRGLGCPRTKANRAGQRAQKQAITAARARASETRDRERWVAPRVRAEGVRPASTGQLALALGVAADDAEPDAEEEEAELLVDVPLVDAALPWPDDWVSLELFVSALSDLGAPALALSSEPLPAPGLA